MAEKHLPGAFEVYSYDRTIFLAHLRSMFNLTYRDTEVLRVYLDRHKYSITSLTTTPPKARTPIPVEDFQVLIYPAKIAEDLNLNQSDIYKIIFKLVECGLLLEKFTNGYTKKPQLFVNVELLNKEWENFKPISTGSSSPRIEDVDSGIEEPTPDEIIPPRASMGSSEASVVDMFEEGDEGEIPEPRVEPQEEPQEKPKRKLRSMKDIDGYQEAAKAAREREAQYKHQEAEKYQFHYDENIEKEN